MENKLKILILEDNPVDAELGVSELEKAGIKFSWQRVETKDEFEKALDKLQPDIILADYKLPSFDAPAALEIALKKCPDTPFIIVTGAVGDAIAVDALKNGATDYILKDHLHKLPHAVESALAQTDGKLKRKQADERVKKQNEFVETVINSLQYPFYVIDTNYAIILANTAARARGIVEGSRCYQVTHHRQEPCSAEHVCHLEEVMRTNKPAVTEHIHFDNDGNPRNFEVHGDPILDKDGRVIQMIEYSIDITERKKTEEALRNSEGKFRAIFDNANDGILLADVETKKFYTGNNTACQMLGYSLEEIKHLGITDIHPKGDLPHVIEQFERQIRGEIAVAKDLSVRRKDGSIIYADVNSSLVTLDGKTHILGLFRDVTERKKAEEALRESEERYRILIQTLPNIIYEVDAEGRFIFVSDGVKQLGYTSEELIGKHFKEIIHPDDFENISRFIVLPKYGGRITGAENSPKLFDERRTSERMTQCLQIRLLRKSQNEAQGDYCYCEVDSIGRWDRFVEDKDKNFLGSIGVIQDITERKKAEEALSRSQEKYVELFENANDSIYTMDLTGKFSSFNHTAAEMLGYSREEFSRLTMRDCLASESYAAAMQAIQKAVTEKSDLKELQPWRFIMVKKDGTFINTEVRTRLIWEEGQITGIQGITRDVTEREKMAGEARKRLQELETFSRVSVGREERMIELKKEIDILKNKLNGK